jgi:hypothetical protein
MGRPPEPFGGAAVREEEIETLVDLYKSYNKRFIVSVCVAPLSVLGAGLLLAVFGFEQVGSYVMWAALPAQMGTIIVVGLLSRRLHLRIKEGWSQLNEEERATICRRAVPWAPVLYYVVAVVLHIGAALGVFAAVVLLLCHFEEDWPVVPLAAGAFLLGAIAFEVVQFGLKRKKPAFCLLGGLLCLVAISVILTLFVLFPSP